ncbi:TRAP transporter small permease [Salipiger sp.]|uniref:TRAP transporter small permease n=1 Tax=Salipiger sp. TaxID=2078585 RepID=UPI003A97B3D1
MAKGETWLRSRAENFVALILGALFFSFLVQILFRYLLNLPLGWSVEFVAMAWLWGILFGYAFVVSEREVIRLDIVYVLMPPGVRRVLDVTTNAICAAIFIWTIPDVWGYVDFMAIEKTSYMKIPFNYVFAIYLPFCLSVIFRCLRNIWRAIKGTTPAPSIEEIEISHEHD